MWPHTEISLVPVLLGLLSDRPLYHSPPRMTMCGTAASVSTLLIVVGMPNTPGLRRIGRLDPRVAPLPLDRVQHRGLFAADVRAGTAVENHLDLLAAAEHVVAQIAPLAVASVDRLLHDLVADR